MGLKETLLHYMPEDIAAILGGIAQEDFEQAQEIRLRVGRPLLFVCRGREYVPDSRGNLQTDVAKGFCITREHMQQTMALLSNHSMYAFEEALKNGYITLPGGHRVGVAGQTVTELGAVKAMKSFNAINIRISHEIKGCGDEAMAMAVDEGKLLHTMIVSPPGCGKTTLLRDMVRQLSNGIPGKMPGQSVGLVDERSEIAGCYMGLPQNDVGMRTDVLDGCPKAEGMLMLLRSMSPKVIAVDEIGKATDVNAIEDIINAGVTLLCTVHGHSLEELYQKPALLPLLEKKILKRFILLDKPGRMQAVFNEDKVNILKRKGVEVSYAH